MATVLLRWVRRRIYRLFLQRWIFGAPRNCGSAGCRVRQNHIRDRRLAPRCGVPEPENGLYPLWRLSLHTERESRVAGGPCTPRLKAFDATAFDKIRHNVRPRDIAWWNPVGWPAPFPEEPPQDPPEAPRQDKHRSRGRRDQRIRRPQSRAGAPLQIRRMRSRDEAGNLRKANHFNHEWR